MNRRLLLLVVLLPAELLAAWVLAMAIGASSDPARTGAVVLAVGVTVATAAHLTAAAHEARRPGCPICRRDHW